MASRSLFVPFLARRNPQADVRVLIAAAYLGVATLFPPGISSSAPLILATPGNPLIEPAAGQPVLDRLIPVTDTLFTGFNLIYTIVIAVVSLLTVLALHPKRGAVTLTAEQADALLPKPPEAAAAGSSPAARLDRFPGWVLLAVILIAYPLGHSIATRGFGASWTINASI